MKKKRLFGLFLSFFISAGGLIAFNQAKSSSVSVAEAASLVDVETVGWNNVDYSYNFGKQWVAERTKEGIPTNGYCLLPLYNSAIALDSYFDENLLTANIPGCNIGDYITINGVASKNVPNTIIYCYPANGFFIYVPKDSIPSSLDYPYLTIEVKEGMSIDGSAQTVATRFEYRGILGSFGNWKINPEPETMYSSSFYKIEWNNLDYSYLSKQKWCGELNAAGAPRDGYCLLAGFKQENKSYEDTVIGDPMTIGRGVLGKGLSCDTLIKVNGVNIVDVEDSICYIYPKYGLFFYFPDASLTYNETYKFPTIEISEGVHFNNVYLPEITFEFRGELGEPSCWTYAKDPSEYNHYDFLGVPNEWNNIAADSNHTQTILQVGEYGTYLKNDKVSSTSNLVSRFSEVGEKFSINGVGFKDIDETLVNYAHGNCYIYMVLPAYALVPSNGYKVVTFHIEANTVFYDTLLPEITLYLYKDKWVPEKPETPEDEDYDTALSLNNVFGRDEITLDLNTSSVNGTHDTSLATFGLYANYKLKDDTSSFVLYMLGANDRLGLRVAISRGSISLFDSTDRDALLGSAEISPFVYDEFYSLLVYTRVISNKVSVYVAVDGITYIHVDGVRLANETNIGNKFSAYLGGGEVTLKKAIYGEDNKKPVLTYTGKAVYGVLSGSDEIDFKNKCTAFDKHDGDVTKFIQVNWENGALTDNKVNKGQWTVILVASDKAGNVAKHEVLVVAADKLDVTVTFDGENATTYRIGDHIAGVADPTKEEANKVYKFVGWYHNGVLWDFENDYIISDMNLESRFQETVEEYIVIFSVIGLANGSSFSLYFGYGARVNVSNFNRDGYTLVAYIGEEEVQSFTVTSNVEVRLVYTSENPVTPSSSGCGGNIATSASIISLISGVAIALLVVRKMKGGKEHE